MKSRRSLVAHAALPMALCFALVGAQPAAAFDASGQSGAGSSSVTPDDGDLIFDGGFEGENGGTSCETAVALNGDEYYAARTNFSTDWMESFGPLPSPSNDVVYSFVADGNDQGSIMPTDATYDFAMFILADCSEGFESSPLADTHTIGEGIDLSTLSLTAGHTYYLAVSGNPSIPPPGSNGALAFFTPPSLGAAPKN